MPELLDAIRGLDRALGSRLETVFVVDSSPDASYARLSALLPATGLRARLVLLSRNFGAFAAIRAGLQLAHGPLFAVMAADLQEPPQLMLGFFNALEHEPVDVVLGERAIREDPWLSRLAANTFWWLYRHLVQKEIPPGGIDVFGCNEIFAIVCSAWTNRTVRWSARSSGWVSGASFSRITVCRAGMAPARGRSPANSAIWATACSLFPICRFALCSGPAWRASRCRWRVRRGRPRRAVVRHDSDAPGYAATVLTVTFFAALNSFALGVVGSYAWRAYENTKRRPASIVLMSTDYERKDQGT